MQRRDCRHAGVRPASPQLRPSPQVAIKILDKRELTLQKMEEKVKREVFLMKSLNHENVVKLHGVYTSKTKVRGSPRELPARGAMAQSRNAVLAASPFPPPRPFRSSSCSST